VLPQRWQTSLRDDDDAICGVDEFQFLQPFVCPAKTGKRQVLAVSIQSINARVAPDFFTGGNCVGRICPSFGFVSGSN
jgi:hypothetical protein